MRFLGGLPRRFRGTGTAGGEGSRVASGGVIVTGDDWRVRRFDLGMTSDVELVVTPVAAPDSPLRFAGVFRACFFLTSVADFFVAPALDPETAVLTSVLIFLGRPLPLRAGLDGGMAAGTGDSPRCDVAADVSSDLDGTSGTEFPCCCRPTSVSSPGASVADVTGAPHACSPLDAVVVSSSFFL